MPIDQRRPFSFHVAGFNTLPTALPAAFACCWSLLFMYACPMVGIYTIMTFFTLSIYMLLFLKITIK